MAKVNVNQVIEFLKNAGAADEDIPKLVMTAYYESTFDTLAQNKDTEAIGLFQINASSFYKGTKPDNTLRSFFGNDILSVTEFEEKLKDPQYNTNFAVHYINRIKKDLEDGSSQFGDVSDNDNDPFAVFEGYLDYVKPYLEGKKISGRGPDEVAQRNDVVIGVGTYLDAFVQVHMNQTKEDILNTLNNTTELKEDEFVKAQPVSEELLEDEFVKARPVSVEEGRKEKEIKDVFTASIYSYLQKQKSVYESQVPKEAGPIDVARAKTDIKRNEKK
tara:strand:- start:936 stop:1757 length:822 start_codon:yes stop_codon:yes gene_type:complete